MTRTFLIAAFLLAICCDNAAPPEVDMGENRKPLQPDPNYRLTPLERQELAPALDPDALEELLAHYPDPEQREKALKEFLEIVRHVQEGQGSITDIRFLGDDQEFDHIVRNLVEKSPLAGRPERLRLDHE